MNSNLVQCPETDKDMKAPQKDSIDQGNVKVLHNSSKGIILDTIVNQMDLDSDEYDEKKSEIADELVDKYDKGQKGYLDEL